MRFGFPLALWSLLAVPALWALASAAGRRRRRASDRLGESGLLTRLYPASISKWWTRRAWVGIAAFALLAVAAARPQYGKIEQTLQRKGVDVLVAVDTSGSMLAADLKPNRLRVAKEALSRLLARFGGNRVGVMDFAGEAYLRCPMTLDHSLARLVLDAIDIQSAGVQGTDLGRVIDVARDAFARGGVGTAVLVLITDGEDNEGKGLARAERAAEDGIRIYAIGIGTAAGTAVPDGRGGFKKRPEDGAVVNSRLDMTGLEAIAAATGGAAVSAEEGLGAAVNRIGRMIEQLEKSELESQKFIIHQDRYGWFIAPAIVMMFWLIVTRPEQPHRLRAGSVEGVV